MKNEKKKKWWTGTASDQQPLHKVQGTKPTSGVRDQK